MIGLYPLLPNRVEVGRTEKGDRDCPYMDCKEKEKQNKDYPKAVRADIDKIKKGSFNFPGIRK